MMERFKGKYRIESNRLRGWDYSNNGHYFITINTYDRACLFGDIIDGEMVLNNFGKIANDEWFRSFEMRNELVADEFILMPNHLHAIVVLESNGDNNIGTVHNVDDSVDNVGIVDNDDTVDNNGIVDKFGGSVDNGDTVDNDDVVDNGDSVDNDDFVDNGDSVDNVEAHGRAPLHYQQRHQHYQQRDQQPNQQRDQQPKQKPNQPNQQRDQQTKQQPNQPNQPNQRNQRNQQSKQKSNEPKQKEQQHQQPNYHHEWQSKNTIITPQPFERKPKSISSFVAGYKSAVLNKIDDYIDEHKLPMQKFNRRNPLWQKNYYDHIIRNSQSYERIAEYIRKNPEMWKGN